MNGCIGVIAEYNPFHKGHSYQLNEAWRISACDFGIVCMSASFVQRGEPACADKFMRTRWALEGGADMVIELPDILSVSCAERFATGGIKLLNAAGIVSGICFGSESGNISLLQDISNNTPDPAVLRAKLSNGNSYPSAMNAALGKNGANISMDSPNDMLGIEYLRAIARINPKLKAFTVKRMGSGYNDISDIGEFASATAIRAKLLQPLSDTNIKALPDNVMRTIQAEMKSGRFPASMKTLSDPILYSLRKLGNSGISALAEVSEGLENPLFNAAKACSNCDELLNLVKTKRYTMARLRRILINALLSSTADLQDLAINASDSLYIRVLGLRRRSIQLLSELNRCAALPIISRHSDIKKLPDNAKRIFDHTALASMVRAAAQPTDKSTEDEFASALIIV